MTTKLPIPTRLSTPLARPSTRERLAPMAVAAGLIAAGAMLWRAKPSALQMPEAAPLGDAPRRGFLRRAARQSRDGLGHFAPDNLSDSLGRSLVLAGGALLATRLLDEIAGRDD